jgi:hypothetical protein
MIENENRLLPEDMYIALYPCDDASLFFRPYGDFRW